MLNAGAQLGRLMLQGALVRIRARPSLSSVAALCIRCLSSAAAPVPPAPAPPKPKPKPRALREEGEASPSASSAASASASSPAADAGGASGSASGPSDASTPPPSGSQGESASSSSSPPPPPRGSLATRSPLLYRIVEGVKDIVSVTFGLERVRDVGTEYDAGLRDYPWVTYVDPHSGTPMYMNPETGVVTPEKPADFDKRASPRSYVDVNSSANALARVAAGQDADSTPWERTLDAVASAPIISHLLSVGLATGQVVADSPIGEAAKKIQARVRDRVEDAKEVWETSQHPLIVNAAYAVDSVLAESETGRAMREIQAIDAGFDQLAFVKEMQNVVIPTVARAFFKLDMPVLSLYCKDTALAQVRAVAAAREVEGITMDGTVLDVYRTDIFQVKSLEKGMPIILVTSQVQYIHAVRNKKGEITEGGDSEIRASMFVLAVTRELNERNQKLSWKVVEMSMQGGQLYL